uniref:Uncharacterized protein n=1 Tax=Nelumbo nucifera TaxID=4432 RepID=A0A822YFG1_NELNU|nr:TPA_asm: hypothetical protein HUJ06_010078 [Nelumbo nucifera]
MLIIASTYFFFLLKNGCFFIVFSHINHMTARGMEVHRTLLFLINPFEDIKYNKS